MTQYLADTGLPFTDRDAAQLKADTMFAESGIPMDVVDVNGGYALEPLPSDDEPDQGTEILLQEALLDYADFPTDADDDDAALTFVMTLRPAWRAQYAGFALLLLGLILLIAPTWPIAVFSAEALPRSMRNCRVCGSLSSSWGWRSRSLAPARCSGGVTTSTP